MALLVRPAALWYYGATTVAVGLLVGLVLTYQHNRVLPAILAAFGLGNRFVLKIAAELIGCAVAGASRDGCEDEAGVFVNPMDSWEVCPRRGVDSWHVCASHLLPPPAFSHV
jgi:hypothetical protein